MVPVSAAWLVLTVWLGRRYAKMDRERVLRENPLAHPTGGDDTIAVKQGAH
jgi:hypothetical protein